MEIEFNGITADKLKLVSDNCGISAEVLPLATRDAICPREEGREFGDGEMYYIAEESCWHGYYYCGWYNCGRSSRYSHRSPSIVREKSSDRAVKGRSGSGCRSNDCSGCNSTYGGDSCDSSSDSLGAIVLIFAIIALILLLIIFAPYIFTGLALLLEVGFVILLGLFDILTFGVFRKKFKRALVYFPKPPSDSQLQQFIGDVAALGGLPRRYHPYGTNGFWILRTGAYLFIPSLVATILVFILGPDIGPNSKYLYAIPIVTLIFSILLVIFGNFLINNKARKVAQAR